MTENVILVLGATGKTGRRVVSRLKALGLPVRAASRSAETRFDWADRTSWGPAVAGASALYLVVPDEPAPVHEFVQQAVAAGVRRVVALSGRGTEIVQPAGMLAGERAARESGVDWTILKPNNFNQNFSEDLFLDPILTGELVLPVGDALDTMVDLEDVADVAVAALTEDGHTGQTYVLSGPRGLSYGEAVGIIAKASGREVRFVDATAEEYVAGLIAQGVPEEFATLLEKIFATVRDGHVSEVTGDIRRVLGRDARDFESYAERTAAEGVWA